MLAVTIPPSGGGSATYKLVPGLTWRLQALSFTCDLSGSATNDDVFVRILTSSNLLIAGEVPGVAQTAGTIITYSLAPELNPCDAITSGFVNLSSDRFTPITLVGGCQIQIDARVTTTGAADNSAVISNGLAWVDDIGAPPDSMPLAPTFIPIPLQAQRAIATGVGAIEGLF